MKLLPSTQACQPHTDIGPHTFYYAYRRMTPSVWVMYIRLPVRHEIPGFCSQQLAGGGWKLCEAPTSCTVGHRLMVLECAGITTDYLL